VSTKAGHNQYRWAIIDRERIFLAQVDSRQAGIDAPENLTAPLKAATAGTELGGESRRRVAAGTGRSAARRWIGAWRANLSDDHSPHGIASPTCHSR
jgi:hypothetical protein